MGITVHPRAPANCGHNTPNDTQQTRSHGGRLPQNMPVGKPLGPPAASNTLSLHSQPWKSSLSRQQLPAPPAPVGSKRLEGDPSDHAVYTTPSPLFLLRSKFISSKTRGEGVHAECRERGGDVLPLQCLVPVGHSLRPPCQPPCLPRGVLTPERAEDGPWGEGQTRLTQWTTFQNLRAQPPRFHFSASTARFLPFNPKPCAHHHPLAPGRVRAAHAEQAGHLL